ncbi:gamma-glutamyl-gamma-aminobutyrate hydrolase family protein [Corynebacterium sp. CNCTC7651]|uniref:glutamine amidotransferase-related protein n=2 Tax=Corynebacterium TaxID=1716 RepID=UPI001F46D681|nr:gamma-glutamyl-gamma-aminobutyrate hydrolase family protein [Corynebacterium sp. CNCTC7651]UIZ93177.1 gamma-glutamyl-gamma-aminobutyrate hydrolase family protein [Corynebacterium sp. CNCTC7651]
MAHLLFLSLRNGDIGPQVARAEYHDALKSAGLDEVDLELRIIDSPDAELGPLDGISGVIVGGSSLNVTNSEPSLYDDYQAHVHAILGEVVNSGLPVFFVCFGLSWLVDHFGGAIGHDHAEDSGPTTVYVTETGRSDVLLGGAPAEFAALTGHTENPQELPSELTLLATGPDGLIQMVRYGEHIWATQFHAEMDADAMRTRMDFYHDYGYFAPEAYARIVADLPNHDVAAANGLVRRFAEYCAAR